MTSITFTKDEEDLIEVLSVPGGWNDDRAVALKSKIRDHLTSIGLVVCCYCRLDMHNRDKFDLDTEHILPKGKYPEFTFELRNLNISCKRCNMRVKREDDSFYSGGRSRPNCFQSQYYRIYHPNFDVVSDHISVVKFHFDNSLLIKYTRKSAKGKEAYRYFRLNEFETDTFDDAQGLNFESVSSAIPDEIAARIRSLLGPGGSF